MIYKTLNNNEFAHWIYNSNSYKNNFSFEGANALQEYLEELSDDIGENIEFDPIAWCCEYSEYENYDEFQHASGGYSSIKDLEELKDNTTVIEFDGGIIIQDF